MTTADQLLNKSQAAELLGYSTRTVDRIRAAGYDLGEVRTHATAVPRFRRSVLLAAISCGKFSKKKSH